MQGRIDMGRELDGNEPDHCLIGSRGVQIHDDLQPGPDDLRVPKPRYDAFLGTDLPYVLNGLKVFPHDTLIICGVASNVCVHYTSAGAHQRDYRVKVVEDCCAGSSVEEHEAAITQINYLQNGARVKLAEFLDDIAVYDGRKVPWPSRARGRKPRPRGAGTRQAEDPCRTVIPLRDQSSPVWFSSAGSERRRASMTTRAKGGPAAGAEVAAPLVAAVRDEDQRPRRRLLRRPGSDRPVGPGGSLPGELGQLRVLGPRRDQLRRPQGRRGDPVRRRDAAVHRAVGTRLHGEGSSGSGTSPSCSPTGSSPASPASLRSPTARSTPTPSPMPTCAATGRRWRRGHCGDRPASRL